MKIIKDVLVFFVGAIFVVYMFLILAGNFGEDRARYACASILLIGAGIFAFGMARECHKTWKDEEDKASRILAIIIAILGIGSLLPGIWLFLKAALGF